MALCKQVVAVVLSLALAWLGPAVSEVEKAAEEWLPRKRITWRRSSP